MPSMKLNNAGVKSKSCGSLRSVAGEGLEEREGHDPDIDRERSQQNIYTGYRSAEALMEYSREHVDQLRDARGRKLRSDAVVMCATVLKPPAAYMATLPREEQIRLLDVAEGVLAKIVGPENIKATGTHFDEQGTHRHVFWEPMTQDGRLCAKEMHNLQFFSQINREIPAALREAGFEIDDCEMYDAAKEEYEKEKAKAGRSSFQFKADAEKAKKEIEQQIDDLQETLQATERKAQKASQSHSEAVKGYEAIKEKVEGLAAQETALTASLERLRDIQADVAACEIEKKPAPLLKGKGKVMVDAAELERVVEQAKAYVVYRPQIDDLELEKEKLRKRELRLREKEQEVSRMDARVTQRDREISARESKVAEVVRQNNAVVAQHKSLYDDLAALRAENATLKDTIKNLTENVIEGLKKRLEELENKCTSMARGNRTILKAIAYVRNFFAGEVASEILQSAYKAGSQWLREDGFPNLAAPEADLPQSVREQMTMKLTYMKGVEGRGVYSPKGAMIMECSSAKEARELFPGCKIDDRTRSELVK